MKKQDYVGLIINDLYIEEQIDDSHYKVKCIHCGFEDTRAILALRQGRKDSSKCRCNCTLSGIKIGDKFNRLTVLKRDLNNQTTGRIYWLCQCDCGNFTSVDTKSLLSGNTKSCGCLNLEKSIEKINKINENLENLIGQQSGFLTVIRLAEKEEIINKPKGPRYWLCQCKCGNTHIVSTSDFKLKKVQSCGCLLSKGEQKISAILEENHINYAKQFYFNDLISLSGRKYYFDFGILDNNNKLLYLIEYDGIQHYDQNHQFDNDSITYEKVKCRDNIKNNYCYQHNIPLIRIPYFLKEITIKDLLLESSNFILKGSDLL